MLEIGEYFIACFNAEQAAQFILKAALIKVSGAKPYTHKFTNLIRMLHEAIVKPLNEDLIKDCMLLETKYFVRYPDAEPTPTGLEEAEICLKIAERIVEHVKSTVKF